MEDVLHVVEVLKVVVGLNFIISTRVVIVISRDSSINPYVGVIR